MLSFEPEIERLRPLLGERAADLLIARERREVFSLYPELRILAWIGAMLVASAAGLFVKNNYERIGPIAIAAIVGAAALACYAWVWSRRRRATIVDDFILVLGALLVSADVAFIETQFHLLGGGWHRHLLLLAIAHGVTAYLFESRAVLSLSISALAGWLGIEQNRIDLIANSPTMFAGRAFLCALLLIGWRAVDRRLRPLPADAEERERIDFAPVFEHFAGLLALAGASSLLFEDYSRQIGCLVTMAIATAIIYWGIRRKSEPFVLYAFVAAVIAFDVLLISTIASRSQAAVFFILVLSTIGAIGALIAIHANFRKERA